MSDLPQLHGLKYIPSPETESDFKSNVDFQLGNVSGWLSVNNYENALIKAKYLVEALEKLVEKAKK